MKFTTKKGKISSFQIDIKEPKKRVRLPLGTLSKTFKDRKKYTRIKRIDEEA